MALVTTDRVKENATVTGFGDVVLVGSPAGFQTFSSIMSVGDTCYYSIVDANSGDWETGIGTLTNTNLLERTTVKSSSNNGLMTSFIGGPPPGCGRSALERTGCPGSSPRDRAPRTS